MNYISHCFSGKLDETSEEDILEQTAGTHFSLIDYQSNYFFVYSQMSNGYVIILVNLLLKARKLEGLKDGLTDDVRQQLASKVYDCRVTSFLLNYTADLMLKLIVAEEMKNIQIPVTL